MSGNISGSIYRVLMSQGLARKTVAAVEARGMEKAGRAHTDAARQVVTDIPREEDTRHRPLPRSVGPSKLKLVVSNKCLPRATPMRGPRNALGRHLVLV